MMRDLTGKVVLITGGASGIGKECARGFLKNNIQKVYIADVDSENGLKTENDFNKEFGANKVKFLLCDVSNVDQFRTVFEACIEQSGNLDIFLNNAGVIEGPKTIPVNLEGVLNGLELGLEYLGINNGHNGGIILNTGSICGFRGIPQSPRYVATKHGVIGLTKVFSKPFYFESSGVKVMVICPGWTNTNVIKNSTDIVTCIDLRNQNFLSPESVAELMIKVVKIGENGSFWIAEDNDVYQVEIPDYTTFKKI